MHPHTPCRKHAFGKAFGTIAGTTASQSGAVTTDTRYCEVIATGYTGQRQDPELGLYYYNARWYDPYLARFTQPDTIVPNPTDAKAFDRYAYVNNNSVRYNDPSGHCVESNGQETGQGGVGYPCPGSTWKKTDPIASSSNSDGGTETSVEPDATQGGGEGAGNVDEPITSTLPGSNIGNPLAIKGFIDGVGGSITIDFFVGTGVGIDLGHGCVTNKKGVRDCGLLVTFTKPFFAIKDIGLVSPEVHKSKTLVYGAGELKDLAGPARYGQVNVGLEWEVSAGASLQVSESVTGLTNGGSAKGFDGIGNFEEANLYIGTDGEPVTTITGSAGLGIDLIPNIGSAGVQRGWTHTCVFSVTKFEVSC
jgi:RHS repeat-associated protein